MVGFTSAHKTEALREIGNSVNRGYCEVASDGGVSLSVSKGPFKSRVYNILGT